MNKIEIGSNTASRAYRRSIGLLGRCLILLFFIGGSFSIELMAQDEPTNEKELRDYAEELFEAKKYGEALERFSQLLSLHPQDGLYNYYYGACIVYADADKEKAFKHLRYSIGREGVPNDVHYFLGKAFHLNYQFADALKSYRLYNSKTENDKRRKWDVELAIQQCENGLKLLSNIKDITVLSKVEASEKEFFRNYDLSDIGGRILVCPEELLSSYDLKSGERFVMYYPGNTSTAFFSSYGKKGENGRDIYRAARLPNGNWSNPIPMTGINTPYDDNFPFLHPDEKTFYFSSKGHNSMGGYDIFKCTYKASDDSFTQPENLDFAVNSPDDDMLYITDQNHELAYFASSRSSDQGEMHVYRVQVSANALQLVLLKGTFIPEVEGVSKSARITVTDATSNKEIGQYLTDENTGDYVIDLPRSGRYKFTVDADGSKLAHNGMVEVPANDEVVAYGQEIRLIETNNIEKLIIKNSFEQALQADLYALAQNILKYRAGLEVNYEGTQETAQAPTGNGEKKVSSAYVDAGFSAALSNEKVLKEARDRQNQLTKKSEDMRKQMNYAYTLAQQKRQHAAKAARDAEDYLRLADAVGEEDVSSKYLMQAMASKFAAEKLSEEARVSLRLSEQLNDRLAEVEQQEQLAEALANDVEDALQRGEYESIVKALETLKEQETAESKDPAHRADEYELLREQAQARRKTADVESNMAQDLREEESSLTMRIKNRKLNLESAKNKDKPAIQREIDVLEADLEDVQDQIEKLFAGMETTQREAEWMSEQAELYRKIENQQTDTYIPEDKLDVYSPNEAGQMHEKISGVEEETSGMEFNMTVVRDILEEEGNVAIAAFENSADFEEFVKKYDLPQLPRDESTGGSISERTYETIQDEIAAAENWMDVIDESVAELEAEREQLPEGTERDSIDEKLAEFQQLKYKKVREIEAAKDELKELDSEKAEPYTIAADETGEDDQQETDNGSDRKTQTIVQSDPIYAEIDPDYEENVAALSEQNLSTDEGFRQKNELDRDFIGKLDDRINQLEQKGEDQLSEDESRDLQLMQLLRRQMAEELAFNERRLAEVSGASEPKTSTEILMEASGLSTEDKSEIAEEPTAETPGVDAAAIPESIGYEDIDPGYSAALKRVEESSASEREKLELKQELHANLVDQINQQIDEYRQLSTTANDEEQLRIEKVISQLNQVKDIKLREIEQASEDIDLQQRTAFANEYEVISEEVDTGYVRKYWSIESSEQEPYFQTVEKARLEQQIVEGIDQRVNELVAEMDATTDNTGKQEIQETIQELQRVRQEKVIAYESLFAQADQLQQSEDAVADTNTPASTSDEGETITESDEPTGATADSEASQPEASADSSEEAEIPKAQSSVAVDEFIGESEDPLSEIDTYTVFGEVNKLTYKSLNASLDMETISEDLQDHQQKMADFKEAYAGESLAKAEREELAQLLQTELELHDRIARTNEREVEFYQVGNSEMLDDIAENPNVEISENEINEARNAQLIAGELAAEARALRRQANETNDPRQRLQLTKEAFELEVEAIESMTRVQRALSGWEDGSQLAFEDVDTSDEPLVQRASVADEPLAEAKEVQTDAASESTEEQPDMIDVADDETTAEEQEVEELYNIDPTDFSEELKRHFELTTEDVERINTQPQYTEWFKRQWAADSLEVLRTQKYSEAERALNEAELLLTESEEVAAAAETETEEAAKTAAYDRSAALQEEARLLFEEARALREQMSRYSSAAEDARSEADELLAGMDENEADELTTLLETAPVAESRASEPSDVIAEESPTESPEEEVATETQSEPESEPEAVIEPEPVAETESVQEETVVETAPDQRVEPIVEPDSESIAEEQPEPATESPGRADIPDIDFSDGVGAVFETTSEPAYSDENPIPVGVEWPDGLVFAVQVGAFRNPIPQDHFRGFTPVRGEVVSGGITRYSAGLFNEFNRANAAKNTIRGMGYSDAFVVAYLNGERIALNRALSETEASEIIAAAQDAQNETNASAEENRTDATTEETESNQAGTTSKASTGTQTAQDLQEFTPGEANTDYYNDPEAVPATQVERIRGLFFTVQVGVYSNPVGADDLSGITPLNSEQTANGYIRYTSGMFPSIDFAQDHRQIVVNAGVADAFVTAYYNGSRITVAQARELLDEQGGSVLAGAQPVSTPEDTTPSEVTEDPTETATPEPRSVTTAEFEENDFADADEFEPEDIRFVIDLGSFGSGMPQQTADAILEIPEAGVTRLELPNGKMHYLSRPTESYVEAESLRLRFVEAGVENLQVRAMALGFLLRLEDARRVTGQ